MDRQTALRKVLRCLRLAASSNPHEAAAALRQARALMDEHNLSEVDAYASEIHDAEAKTRCHGARPTASLTALVNVVADGFRCQAVVARIPTSWSGASTVIRFFGAGSDAEIAAYAFTVLRRQLESDKAKHTARVRKRANKERRGEEFAFGWIVAVRHQFPAADLAHDRKAAINHAIEGRLGKLREVEGREIGKNGRTSYGDRHAGYLKGTSVRVNPGVGGSSQRSLEHGT